MNDALEERIEALERTVTDGEFDHELSDHNKIENRLSAVESQLEAIDTQIDDLEAATQALRGYVGNIRAVNDDVEQRANAALAKAEALEATFDSAEKSGAREVPGTDKGQALREESAEAIDSNQETAVGAGRQDDDRCQVCGRAHDSGPQRKQRSIPGATDGGSSTHTEPAQQSERTNDPLIPDDSEETGTLQRVRELL